MLIKKENRESKLTSKNFLRRTYYKMKFFLTGEINEIHGETYRLQKKIRDIQKGKYKKRMISLVFGDFVKKEKPENKLKTIAKAFWKELKNKVSNFFTIKKKPIDIETALKNNLAALAAIKQAKDIQEKLKNK